MLEVAEQRFKVNSLLAHAIVSEQKANTLVNKDAGKHSQQLRTGQHECAKDPAAAPEEEGQDHDACIKLDHEEVIQLVLEGTALAYLRTDRALVGLLLLGQRVERYRSSRFLPRPGRSTSLEPLRLPLDFQ